jgi:hypothetical protein
MTNCNSTTTLKMTKNFIIGPRTIIKKQKTKELKLTNLKRRGQRSFFFGRERKEGRKKTITCKK